MSTRPIPCGATTASNVEGLRSITSRIAYLRAVCLLDPGHDGPHVDSTLDHYAWDEPAPPEER